MSNVVSEKIAFYIAGVLSSRPSLATIILEDNKDRIPIINTPGAPFYNGTLHVQLPISTKKNPNPDTMVQLSNLQKKYGLKIEDNITAADSGFNAHLSCEGKLKHNN